MQKSMIVGFRAIILEIERTHFVSLMEASAFFAFCENIKDKIILLQDRAEDKSSYKYKEGL